MAAIVRPATTDDLDAVLRIRADVAAERIWIATEAPIDVERDRVNFTKTITDSEAGQPVRLFVAVVDGEVVGSLGILGEGGVAHLGMNVADGHRGAGIGSGLLRAAVDWARQAGIHKIELEHWPWNHAARALYERHGFVEEGYRRRQYRRRDGSLWDTVLMGLVLDDDAPGHEVRADRPPV